MKVGVPKETAADERRVALVPEIASRLAGAGIEVVAEPRAGAGASFTDDAFREAGAVLGDPWESELVAKVRTPSDEELERLRDGQLLVGFLEPLTDREGVERLASRGVIAFAMESIPRITRAQPMDALSSQATVSGYKAVIVAAERLPRFLPMLMTAAGTVAPAKVLVIGAGVAGLQAIATARSLGAGFLELGVVGEEGEGGYARELTEEEQRRQQAELEARIGDFDVVVTTALVPGRPAPRLIPRSSVESMRPGSMIVDLAAEAGGNCELTRADEDVVHEGVTILGPTNLPSTMPYHASQLYARNVSALVQHLAPEGELRLDWDDEITAGACVTRKEEVPA